MGIKDIIDKTNQVFETLKQGMTLALPPIMLQCLAVKRTGLSATMLASRIIARLPEAGIPNGKNADGSDNLICRYTRLISEEIVYALKNDMRIDGVMPVGAGTFYGTGSNAGGPIVIISKNIVPLLIKAIAT